MAAENKAKSSVDNRFCKSKKGKQRYLPHNKPVKKKGAYPLRPGVQGFFITCDGGRERQACQEAINVIESFFEELVYGNDSSTIKVAGIPNKPLNTKIKFADSDSDSSDDDDGEEDEEEEQKVEEEGETIQVHNDKDVSKENATSDGLDPDKNDDPSNGKNETEGKTNDDNGIQESEAEEPPTKKQCLDTQGTKSVIQPKLEEKSIDKLIEAELEELADKKKRRFFGLDSGCNGVVFIQMRKKDAEPSPTDVVQHLITSASVTKKHMSRFILRVLPVEVVCYASEEDITRAIKPLVSQYFPSESPTPRKFAVLYEARSNTGIDRMKIINAVAKSVPQPYKVDLNHPEKTIIVEIIEIIKTICLIGVVERYKELCKYNLRQLTS